MTRDQPPLGISLLTVTTLPCNLYRNFKFTDVCVDGARAIAEACRDCGVERLIHFSALNAAHDSPSKLLQAKVGQFLVQTETKALITMGQVPRSKFKIRIVHNPHVRGGLTPNPGSGDLYRVSIPDQDPDQGSAELQWISILDLPHIHFWVKMLLQEITSHPHLSDVANS